MAANYALLNLKEPIIIIDSEHGSTSFLLHTIVPIVIKCRDSELTRVYVFVTRDNINTSVVIAADSIMAVRRIVGLSDVMNVERVLFKLSVQFSGGVSLVNNFSQHFPKEIMYIYMGNAELVYEKSTHEIVTRFEILKLQIDNTSMSALHPTLLHSYNQVGPDLGMLYVISRGQIWCGGLQGSDTVKEVVFRINKMKLQVDAEIILDIIYVVQAIKKYWLPMPADNSVVQHYFGSIKFERIKFRIYFNADNEKKMKQVVEFLHPNPSVATMLGIANLNLHNLPLELPMTHFGDLTCSWGYIMGCLSTFYLNALRDLFLNKNFGLLKTLGSLEAIGNPGQAIQRFSDGTIDLFTKNPIEGTASFGSNIISGFSGMGTKVTGMVGHAFARTYDDEYQIERKKDLAFKKPQTVGDGFSTGAGRFVKGIGAGISGLITDPIAGGKKDGFLGGLKGAGLGVLGVFTKPLGGAVDFMSTSFAGLETLTVAKGSSLINRIRIPRQLDLSQAVRPYCLDKAKAAQFIYQLFDQKYVNMVLVGYIYEDDASRQLALATFILDKCVVQVKGDRSLSDVLDLRSPLYCSASIVQEVATDSISRYRVIPGQGVEIWLCDTGTMLFSCKQEAHINKFMEMLATMMAAKTRFVATEKLRIDTYFTRP